MLLIIGVAFIYAGLVFWKKLIKVKKTGIVTIARISAYKEDARGFKIYPVYEFFDQKGNLIRAESTFSIFTYQKHKVKIIYNSNDPSKIIPYHWLVLNGPTIVLLIGVLFIFFSFL